MKSYASVDRIEAQIAICEVEMLETCDSDSINYGERVTEMMDISLEKIEDKIGQVEEGDILTVEHDGAMIFRVYEKDEKEKQRRIDALKAIMEE